MGKNTKATVERVVRLLEVSVPAAASDGEKATRLANFIAEMQEPEILVPDNEAEVAAAEAAVRAAADKREQLDEALLTTRRERFAVKRRLEAAVKQEAVTTADVVKTENDRRAVVRLGEKVQRLVHEVSVAQKDLMHAREVEDRARSQKLKSQIDQDNERILRLARRLNAELQAALDAHADLVETEACLRMGDGMSSGTLPGNTARRVTLVYAEREHGENALERIGRALAQVRNPPFRAPPVPFNLVRETFSEAELASMRRETKGKREVAGDDAFTKDDETTAAWPGGEV